MRPHPRIRKTIKWGGAAVTLLLAAVWFGSGWYRITWQDWNPTGCGVLGGDFYLSVPDANARGSPGRGTPGWRGWSATPDWHLHWFQHNTVRLNAGSVDIYLVPLWVLALACGLATASAWWFDALAYMRVRLGLCPKCSYNRAGLARDAKCPECGSESAAP